MKWKNVPFMITANCLPPVLIPPVKGPNETEISFKNRKHDHEAMMTRIKMTEVKQSHPNSTPFPYTADELAIYMNYLCEQYEP